MVDLFAVGVSSYLFNLIQSLYLIRFSKHPQACYGHTEGGAGVTGMLMAVSALGGSESPGIMCLRGLNPYVGAALEDWGKATGTPPLAPRQMAGRPARVDDTLGGAGANV